MPRSAKTSTSDEVFGGSTEGSFDKLPQMNEKLLNSFNERLSQRLPKLTENIMAMVQNMMLQITKSFMDCILQPHSHLC